MVRLWTSGIILMFFLVGTSAQGFDWCNHKCPPMSFGMPPTEHTMCIYQEGGGPACKDYRRGFTREEKQMILDYHNELRQNVANGLETRGVGGPQPSAADMMRLVWDSEVEMIAQRWADQCRHPPHDECRQTMDGEPGGQNSGGAQGYGRAVDRMATIKSLIKRWYDEVISLVPSDVDSVFANSPGMIGHYTQVVWGQTTAIGCGFTMAQAGQTGSFHTRMICNYKPSGNVVSYPIYTRGPPASKCPSGSYPSTRYSGLCETANMGDLVTPQTPTPPSTTPQVPPATTPQVPPATTPQVPPATLPVAPPAYSPPPSTPIQQPSAPTQTTTQEETKPSFLWRVITLPWRIFKWFFSIPIKVYEFIKEKLFS